MKKITLIISTVILAVVFCACSSSSSPKAVVNDYYKALKSGDFEKAMTYTTLTDEAEIQQNVKKMQDFKFQVTDYEILSEEIAEDGETATVDVKYTASNAFKETPEEQNETVKLVKVDGKWKIKE